VRAGG